MGQKRETRRVYSTDQGRLCPECEQPRERCQCGREQAAPAGDGIVRLHRQTKGRGGKAVTLVTGTGLAGAELKALAKALKQRCGVGGAVRDGDIEIQGDQRTTLKPLLEAQGFRVKIAGG
jgi:translation initiation factor 1